MSNNNSTTPVDNSVAALDEDAASTYNWGAPPPASAPAWDFPVKTPVRDDKNDTKPAAKVTAPSDSETIYEGNLTDRQHRQQSQTGGWDRSGGW